MSDRDPWAPVDEPALPPESTRVDPIEMAVASAEAVAAMERAAAIRAERRAAYLDGVPDEHHPDL